MKKMRMVLALSLAFIVSAGMTVSGGASGGDVNISTTIGGQHHQIVFPAGSEAAIAYNRDVRPLLPNGRGRMSDAAIAAMNEWRSRFVYPMIESGQAGQSTSQTPIIPQPTAPWLCPEVVEGERQELIRLINDERERVGSNRLAVCDYLTEFAGVRADEGGRAGGAPHTRPNGDIVPNELASSWQSAQTAFNAWMDSPGHRDAMLGTGAWANHTQRTIGVGIGKGGSIMIFD